MFVFVRRNNYYRIFLVGKIHHQFIAFLKMRDLNHVRYLCRRAYKAETCAKFAVPYNVLVGYRSEEEEIKRLLDDVAEEYPDYEPIETATACDDKRIFVAVKCKVKEEKK